jgi:hypothetical protein
MSVTELFLRNKKVPIPLETLVAVSIEVSCYKLHKIYIDRKSSNPP